MSPHGEFETQRQAGWHTADSTTRRRTTTATPMGLACRDRLKDDTNEPPKSSSSSPPPPPPPPQENSPTARPPFPLRQRPKPLPFILPCPLGPLPPPGGTTLQAVPATQGESTPRAFFAPPQGSYPYPWPGHSTAAPARLDGGRSTYASPSPTATATACTSFPPGSDPAPTGRWTSGTCTFHPSSPGGSGPPVHACYPRSGTGLFPEQPAASAAAARSPVLASRMLLPPSAPPPPQSSASSSSSSSSSSSPHAYYYSPGPPAPAPAPAPDSTFPPPETQHVLYPGQPAATGQYPPRELALQYRCDQCLGVFASDGGLKRHKKTHSAARRYQGQHGGGAAAYASRAVF